MDSLDLFFKKYSYKFDKGYPDMNSEKDVLLLESILLNELGINLNEDKASDRTEAKEILKKELGLSDSDFKDTGLNFYVLVPGNQRSSFVDKIENIDTFLNALVDKHIQANNKFFFQYESLKIAETVESIVK